jgi:O-methyltransferase
MQRINVPITEEVESYIDRRAYRDHPALAACRAEAQTRGDMAVMQVAPEQAALLQMLIGLLGARRVLEIGTFTGYSALAMALALPPEGRLTTLDIDPAIVDVARTFWTAAGIAERIDAIVGDAGTSLTTLISAGEVFDLVLIDADKPRYAEYYEKSLRLLRSGGVLVLDDTLLRGRVVSGPLPGDPEYVVHATDVVCSLNDAIHSQPGIEMVMLPWRDGLTIVHKH